MNGQKRANIKSGLKVKIVLKEHQRCGTLTEGVVGKILTNSPDFTYPHHKKILKAQE